MKKITDFTGRLGNQMFQFSFLFTLVKEGVISDIYLQNEDYFGKYREEIKKLFSDDINYLPYVAVHVRRGDYVDNSFYVDLFKEGYYEKAMKKFPNATFLVFSDDIEWCEKQPVFKDCKFAKGNGEVHDLNLMASCEGHIIANSSFSWWGAYLNRNKSKKVFAPKPWTDSHNDDVYFNGMITVPR